MRGARAPSGGERTIETEADIRAGIAALRRKCPAMRRIHATAGDPPLRRHSPGFEGLARIVVSQQLSTASADAIWRRTLETLGAMNPQTLADAGDDVLRRAGLSRGKVKTLRAISEAVLTGALALERAAIGADADVHDMLTRFSGIGPWTADIYILFCLGRRDAFAPGDLALQVATQAALGLASRPTAREIAAIAERWRPWRGVAARLLWAYYPHARRA